MKTKEVITVNYAPQANKKKKVKSSRLRMRTIRTKNDDFIECLTFSMQYIPKDPRLKSMNC